jgi:hypothetical protein
VGLSPTVDENSIKVEGSGIAVITDITCEQLPNRDIFEEIYPDDDDDEDLDDEDDEQPDENEAEEKREKKVNVPLDEIRERLVNLRDEQKRAKEAVANAESQLKLLDAHAASLSVLAQKSPVDIADSLLTYRLEREKVFQSHMEGIVCVRRHDKEIADLNVEEKRLKAAQDREEAKESKVRRKAAEAKIKAKQKEQAKRARREEEQRKEKDRVRREREQFWPRCCYSVRITLEVTALTPTMSRRSSMTSMSDLVKVNPESANAAEGDGYGVPTGCDLVLSYMTSSAFWSPSYDLALSTTKLTASLCFDAKLTNMTSETWANCKLILSTSQTSFRGLQDNIPVLQPWRIKLAAKGLGMGGGDISVSREEQVAKGGWLAQQRSWISQKPRSQLFGRHPIPEPSHGLFGAPPLNASLPPPPPPPAPAAIAPGRAMAFGSAQAGSTLFGNPTTTRSPFQSQSAAPAALGGSLFGSQPEQARGGSQSRRELPSQDTDGITMLEAVPELAFQESAVEETGLTTNYDMPGTRTLKPSSTPSKQRVAAIPTAGVLFSRTVVAKFKPAAYLKVKIRNASKWPLLAGPTGLTLDGTFMGRSTLPRCSAGDSFSMSLGIDPAVHVTYPKPEVRRSTTGMFSKENNSVYKRLITLVNTRTASGQPVSITVLDQVPVSEDEKLRVSVLDPKGLYEDGAPIAAGVASRGVKEDKDWGRASAMMKKGGQVVWDVSLKPGRGVTFTLEYEVLLPVGDTAVQC